MDVDVSTCTNLLYPNKSMNDSDIYSKRMALSFLAPFRHVFNRDTLKRRCIAVEVEGNLDNAQYWYSDHIATDVVVDDSDNVQT
jgi:hypothetical protein